MPQANPRNTPQSPAPRRAGTRGRLAAPALPVALSAAVALGLAGCSGSTSDAPATGSATSGAASSAGSSATAGGTSTAALTPVALQAAPGVDAAAASGHSLNLPAGWSGQVWANVPGARIAAWTPDGKLLVSGGAKGTLTLVSPDTNGGGPTARVTQSDLADPQGIAFATWQGRPVLVLGEEDKITAWDYADGGLSNRRVLVDRLPTGGHGSKAVTIRDTAVFYSLGSSGNREPGDRDADPERATVWQVGLDGSGNKKVARGIRNGFGLAIAPDRTLFTAVNQSDNVPYPYRDDSGNYGKVVREFVNENPVEQVTRLTDGVDLGWPYCMPDIRNSPTRTNIPYVAEQSTNADGTKLDCGKLPPTMLGLPAHSAPLGLAFTQGTALEKSLGNGALVAAHGSWNRTPPQQPYVTFSPWDAKTNSLGPAREIVTGFQGDDGKRWGRSVMALPGADGALYLTDDTAGLVYRLTPPS